MNTIALRKLQLKGFTLVELIVVITILAILGTLGFVSVGNFSSKSRDAYRASSLGMIRTGLSATLVERGELPRHDSITSTGIINNEELVYVGDLSEKISKSIQLSKAPKDPLSKHPFVYGADYSYRYYQVATTLENTESTNLLIETVHAAETIELTASVDGNYSGLMKKGSNLYNVPSLIYTGSGNLISTDTYFVVDGEANLPYFINTSTANSVPTTEILKEVTGASGLSVTGVTITDWGTQSGTIATTLGYMTDTTETAFYGNSGYQPEPQIPGNSCNFGENSVSGNCQDPYIASVASMLHFNGNFTDEKGKIWTPNGNITTGGTGKFGASAIFDGSGDFLSTTSHADFGFGSSDFTIELWFKPNRINNNQMILDMRPGENGSYTYIGGFGIDGDSKLSYHSLWTERAYTGASTLTQGQWQHIAISRQSSTSRLFVNGIKASEVNDTVNYTPTSSIIGRNIYTAIQDLNAEIDEFRITKGVAMYTGNFPPPVVQFPDN